jgi:hypothetical protein
MDKDDIIRMAREAGGFLGELPKGDAWLFLEEEQLERFAALIAAAERETIQDEFWMSLQADLEHGVKYLNEKAAAEYYKNYPGLVQFAGWLKSRGNQ